MADKKLRIVFMGTPEFAVASLKALVDSGENVVGVITAPDRPKGRGKKLAMSAVKEYALEAGLNILQPNNLKAPEFIEELKALEADVQVVVAFRMLPEIVWSMPPQGTFNLHGSLLPQYRGAAPINWAIMNGEKETGVTTFFLKHQIDTGNIILQQRESIHEDDNVGTVYERLMNIGAELVVETIHQIESGSVNTLPQDESGELKEAPKIFKEDCKINWNQSAEQVNDFVRGLSPYPAAWMDFHDSTAKVFKVKTASSSNLVAGQMISDGKSILIGTTTENLEILELQLQGKKRMQTPDFLRGYRWPEN